MAEAIIVGLIVLFVTFMAFNAWSGYRHGLRRTTIRLAFVAVSFVLSLLCSGLLWDSLSDAFGIPALMAETFSGNIAFLYDYAFGFVKGLSCLELFALCFIVIAPIGEIFAQVMKNAFKEKDAAANAGIRAQDAERVQVDGMPAVCCADGVAGSAGEPGIAATGGPVAAVEPTLRESKKAGLAMGVVLGLVISLCVIAPLNGALYIAGTMADAVLSLNGTGIVEDLNEEDFNAVVALKSTPVPEVYSATAWFVSLISPCTISAVGVEQQMGVGEVADCIEEAAEFARVFASLNIADIHEIDTATVDEVFSKLDSAKGELSEKTINLLSSVVAETIVQSVDAEIDAQALIQAGFDFNKVDFAREGKLLETYSTDSTANLSDCTVTLLQSELIVYVLYCQDQQLGLTEDQKAEVSAVLEADTTASAGKKNAIKSIFGITQ